MSVTDFFRTFYRICQRSKTDSNNLTRSGYITPAVDFSKLQEVLVITTTKSELIKQESGNTEESNS